MRDASRSAKRRPPAVRVGEGSSTDAAAQDGRRVCSTRGPRRPVDDRREFLVCRADGTAMDCRRAACVGGVARARRSDAPRGGPQICRSPRQPRLGLALEDCSLTRASLSGDPGNRLAPTRSLKTRRREGLDSKSAGIGGGRKPLGARGCATVMTGSEGAGMQPADNHASCRIEEGGEDSRFPGVACIRR